jgi:S-adenosylmethionine-dependent methyltransferase
VVDHRRSALRTAVVWEALVRNLEVLQRELTQARPLQVLDLGGGTGGFAVRVAELGHRATVVDPSPDALASLARRAADAGVSDQVRGL